MHIIYIITKLELGGAQKVCLALCKALEKQGDSVTLITSNTGILVPSVSITDTHFLPCFTREVSWRYIWSEFITFITLVRLLKKYKKKYTHVLVHTHSTKAGILGRWAAVCAGITYRVHTIHGYAFHAYQSFFISSIIYFLELITSFITTHYICVSSVDILTGTKSLPGFSRKFSLIRAAVNISLKHTTINNFTNTSTSISNTPAFIFGTIACFKPQKNIEDLIRAFAYVHARNTETHLEIIGDGVLRPQLEGLIAYFRLEHAVTLWGWQHRVTDFLPRWQAFVLTSLWEGLPCAVVEARLYKLPVLAYNTGGIKDIILHNTNGLLYTQKDWHSLAQGMLRISTRPDHYYQFCNYPDNLAAFSPYAMAESHYRLYHSLFKTKSSIIN